VLISFETGYTGEAWIPGTSDCYLQFPMRARVWLHLVADGRLTVWSVKT